MPDAIPGARYKDNVLDAEMICNGVVAELEEDEEYHVVVLEYDGADRTISVPFRTFRDDDTIDLIEHP